MNKDEILKKAQEENKGADLADLNAQQKGAYISYFVGVVGIIMVNIIEGIVLERINYGADFIICLMVGVAFLYKYINLRKKHELFVTICYFSLSIMFLVFWILVLAKVW